MCHEGKKKLQYLPRVTLGGPWWLVTLTCQELDRSPSLGSRGLGVSPVMDSDTPQVVS